MKLLKKILFRLLGINTYLSIVSRVYLILVNMKLIRADDKYYLHTLIKETDHCIDIGANLGYYSVLLGKIAKKGKVYAIEPIPLFLNILKKNIGRFQINNVTIYPYALGENDGESINMHTPIVNGVFRHGLTKIGTTEATDKTSYSVTMRNPKALFQSLPQLDYIKCDVEGYEDKVIPLFDELIHQHKPILQIEISSKNKDNLIPLIRSWGYTAHVLNENKLVPYKGTKQLIEGDVYFLPS